MNHEKYYQHFLNNNPYPRHLKNLEAIQGFSSIYLKHHGKKIINFSSSDYLGLSNHPALVKSSQEFVERYGVGASSSRLVTGNFDCYTELETNLAKALGKPAALILGTGYQTNMTVLEALFDQTILRHEPLIFSDKLCHASMMSVIKNFSGLERFRHNNLDHLRHLLDKHINSDRQKFILVESVYSMEGDEANLAELIQIAKDHQAFLYVDDAHGVGVFGQNGWGKTVEHSEHIPLIMGTFSKALGSSGGYIGCSELMRNYLINKCRGLIYSTGLSPAILGAMTAAIELQPQLHESRLKLLKNAERVRQFFHTENINCGDSTTHIIPWIIGDAKKTLEISAQLEKQGILGTAIQPPSVPNGKSRIRFCLSAGHSDSDIDLLLEAILRVNALI
ncbi:MAG: 8-amino-7-oxononanoate synthase [Gammaproteobacteria bacterium]